MARILLADDDQAARNLVKRALEAEGHTVDIAEDGTEALRHFKAAIAAYDLIVSDVEMPGVDGVTLAKEALAASPNVRILLVSGHTEALERGRGLGAARLGILAKPFTLEQIRRTVATVLA